MNNKQDLINFVKNQVQYTKYFKEEDALEGMKYWEGRFNQLALKVLCMDDDEEEIISFIQPITLPKPNLKVTDFKPYVKRGNQKAVKTWVELRNAHIKKLYDEAKKNNVLISDDLIKSIAQRVGTTVPKCTEIVNLLSKEI